VTTREVAHNLPSLLSSFVGRHEEMAAVARLLERTRLVTLVGTAGVGKTRLALQVASTISELHDEAVWLVQLAPVDDPSLIVAAVATTLGVREQPGRSMLQALISHLSSRRLLLVLDNCEHVIGAAAAFVGAVLGACLELRILATSRQALGVDGEAAWPVPALSVPPAPEASAAEGLAAYEAVRLFVERAVATDASFALNPAVGPAVAEICRRLDGVPLAIELAAARVGVLAPAEIAARLDDRFRLLTAGSRTAAPRHQSMQAALEWSYGLLCDAERVLLSRLSVFAGGFALEAAEEVCAADTLPANQVFHLLAELVAKSLVVADTSGEQTHYRLLETFRHYSAGRLAAAGEAQAVGDRHAAYYTRLADLAEPQLTGARQGVWIERLDAEQANLRAALEWSLTCGQPEQGLRLAGALGLFWLVRGYLSEGRAWLDQALAANPDACPSLRAKALWALGSLAGWADEYAVAVAIGKESLALYQELGDIRGVARALQLVGASTLIADPAKGRPLLRHSVALARQTQDRWCLTGSLGLSGMIESYQGDLVAARPPLEECLGLAREAHDKRSLLLGVLGLGIVMFQEGDHGGAEGLLLESLAVARALGSPRLASLTLVTLAELARVRGDFARGHGLLKEGLGLGRESGSPWIAAALHAQGRLSRDEGDPEAASRLFAEALVIAETAGSKRIAAWVLLDMSDLPQARGDLDTTRARIDEAVALATDSGSDHVVAQALYRRGQLARSQGDRHQAETSHHEALRLWRQTGQRVRVAASLEAIAGLAADRGRAEHAARLLASAQAFREKVGYVRPPAEQAAYDADLACTRKALSPEGFAVAWGQGAGLSLEEAVAYVAKGRGPRLRPTAGWASLTKAERDVALLAAQGLTNTEIGQRLFTSPSTAKAHLAHIFAKLGITSRRQLRRGGQPGV
jgi:predicted ATPase/DNA-binding CsgD family transcriptional regulator